MRHSMGLLAACALTVYGCAGDSGANEPVASDVDGSCASAFDGQMCTWAKMQGASVLEVGATVPVAVLEQAPMDAPPAWPPVPTAVAALPAAVREATGLDHVAMYWEAGGHPPAAYMTPHFDFHFYAMSTPQREAIDCADLAKPTAPPADYTLPDIPLPPEMAAAMGVEQLTGLCVPQMGMHAMLTSEMAQTDAFRGTMIVGYYGGKPIFVEPMLTKAMLLEKQSFGLPVPHITGMAAQPTAFRADYDAAANAYRFIFSGFGATM